MKHGMYMRVGLILLLIAGVTVLFLQVAKTYKPSANTALISSCASQMGTSSEGITTFGPAQLTRTFRQQPIVSIVGSRGDQEYIELGANGTRRIFSVQDNNNPGEISSALVSQIQGLSNAATPFSVAIYQTSIGQRTFNNVLCVMPHAPEVSPITQVQPTLSPSPIAAPPSPTQDPVASSNKSFPQAAPPTIPQQPTPQSPAYSFFGRTQTATESRNTPPTPGQAASLPREYGGTGTEQLDDFLGQGQSIWKAVGYIISGGILLYLLYRLLMK